MTVAVDYGTVLINAPLCLIDENNNDITEKQFVLKSSLMLDFGKLAANNDDYYLTYDRDEKKMIMSEAAYTWFRDRIDELQFAIDENKLTIECMAS